jgi:hypothetical protein
MPTWRRQNPAAPTSSLGSAPQPPQSSSPVPGTPPSSPQAPEYRVRAPCLCQLHHTGPGRRGMGTRFECLWGRRCPADGRPPLAGSTDQSWATRCRAYRAHYGWGAQPIRCIRRHPSWRKGAAVAHHKPAVAAAAAAAAVAAAPPFSSFGGVVPPRRACGVRAYGLRWHDYSCQQGQHRRCEGAGSRLQGAVVLRARRSTSYVSAGGAGARIGAAWVRLYLTSTVPTS